MIDDILIHRILAVPYVLHISKDIRKSDAPTIIFIHGLGSSASMWKDITPHLHGGRLITVDLLGFGKSPKPSWSKYNTRQQARCLRRTLLKQQVRGEVILVGHSLGALVAVEFARKWPRKVSQLVLCSPPLFRPSSMALKQENAYKRAYHAIRSNSTAFERVALFYSEYLTANKGMLINSETLPAYFKTLEAAIENGNAMQKLEKIKIPTTLLYGVLDPLIVTKNIQAVAEKNENITLQSVTGGHEIIGLYKRSLLKHIRHITYQAQAHPK